MITIGVDLGTTTITCVAWDFEQRRIAAVNTVDNQAEITRADDKKRGRSEWDAAFMVKQAIGCLTKLVEALQASSRQVVGIGITGQQHGVVLLDDLHQPVSPLVNWQDRRAEEEISANGTTFVQRARDILGSSAPQRMGCHISPGYLGMTLFCWKERGQLPATGTCCFITDYFASQLTNEPPVTDATMGASSGLLNVEQRQWDTAAIQALGLPNKLFPQLDEPTTQLGKLPANLAKDMGLTPGTPVFIGLGDNQAAFIGSVGDPQHSLLVNVGTGGQVGAWCDHFVYAPPLETRPFPVDGYLLVNAGLCGGRSYAALERMFQLVGEQLFGVAAGDPLYDRMNELASRVAQGADGLHCSPLFTGTRSEPHLRASFQGADPLNFTPAHMIRALLEGMVDVFFAGGERIEAAAGRHYDKLVGAGNGLRQNQVLAEMLMERMHRRLSLTKHQEEAAVGAALVAGVGSGLCADLTEAGRQIISAD